MKIRKSILIICMLFTSMVIFNGIVFGKPPGNDEPITLEALGSSLNWDETTGADIYSSPTIVDLDIDGDYEVLIASTTGELTCFDKDGNTAWSNPVIFNG